MGINLVSLEVFSYLCRAYTSVRLNSLISMNESVSYTLVQN